MNFVREARARAEERFSRTEKPMAFPEGEWEPNTIEMGWELKPVPKSVEKKVGDFVVRRGEFGWLEEERMDEIAGY